MPKRENTTDSSGETTDFVHHVLASHHQNSNFAEGNEQNTTSTSLNFITTSFNNKNSKNSSFRSPPDSAAAPTSQQQSKRLKLDSTQLASSMSLVAHPTANSNDGQQQQQHLSPAHSNAIKVVNGADNGHNASSSVTNSSATSSSASSPSAQQQHVQYNTAGVGDDGDATSAIVNIITDNANYKVMDGVQVSKTNLIVNYIPQQMSQDDLQKLFERFGTLESCKLIRDKTTNLSLGYAFVNFLRAEDAEKAIFNANGMRIHNKSLKVSYARPSTEDIKGANLYVSGIPKTWTEHDLKKYFYGHGRIITGRILVDNKTGLSKGVGFIRFDTREEAQSAINALNNTVPADALAAAQAEGGNDGTPVAVEAVTVKFANNPTHTPNNGMNGMANGNMLMGNNNANRQNFQQNFVAMSAAAQLIQQQQQQQAAVAAAVRRVSLGGNPAAVAAALGLTTQLGNNAGVNPLVAAIAGRIRNTNGGGFASTPTLGNTTGFSDADLLASTILNGGVANSANFAALLAAGSLGGGVQNGMQQQQTMNGGGTFAMPANVMQNGNGMSANGGGDNGLCLFVYNLPPDAEESLLWQLFAPFGSVQNVKIVRDNITQRCKGFGFVTMANQMDAYNAMQNLDGYSLAGRPLQVKKRTVRGGSNGGSLVGNGGGGCVM